jgi:penicillin-binding protein 2
VSSSPFLPPDPRVEEPYRLTPQLAVRIAVLGVLAIVVFAVLFFRLWALQVISGEEYLSEARGNQIRQVRLQPPRGPILDRDGTPLVTNVPGTVVQLWPADVPEGQLPGVIRRLAALLDVPEKDIRKAVRARRDDPLTPVIVKTSVHESKAYYLQEHKADFPGVVVASTQLRRYEERRLAAHTLGYVGEVSPEELERLGDGYEGGDIVGKAGVEATYDRYLRGEPGIGQVRVNALGERTSSLTPSQLPKAGYALRLTIDGDLQRAAEQALQYGIRLARDGGAWAANGGAIVAMNPENGEILALASYPTYDPKVFTTRDPEKIAALYNEPGDPLVNRAIYGTYPPGSTFKPVAALAALEEGLLTPYDYYQCEPERTIGGQTFINWDPYRNEPMQLATALAASCDTYFYDVGLSFYYAKGSPMKVWGNRFGFGERTGIDIGPEARGLIPTPAWRRRHYETEIDKIWTPGHSVQLAIGQGDLLVTPLQMTRFYALLANGGKLVYPHLVMQVEQPAPAGTGQEPKVLRSFAAKPPQDLGLDPNNIAAIDNGLWLATHDPGYGTSYQVFGNYEVPIVGKTGTAEKFYAFEDGTGRMMDQAWWCGWGPYGMDSYNGKPPLVVCVLIENGGHGGEVAAPAALQVFEQYFGVEAPPFVIARPSD